jgi:simple sugar transport system substrate-binding protein
MKKFYLHFTVLLILAVAVTACQPSPTPEVTQPTPVPQETAPTAPAEPPPAVEEPPAEATGVPEAPAPAAPAQPTGERLNFVMVQHALCAWDAFWCMVEQGIADAAQDMDIDITVLGPDEFNLERTASLIDQAIATQPDGIALTVSDPVLFREPINRAIAGGIPVIAYNAGAGPIADGIPYLTYLGQDEYQGGYLGGLRMADAGGEVGVCINHQVGHVGLDARCRGFTDAFEERGFTAAVLAISSDPAASQTTIDDYYTANPNVNAFMTLGPTGANPFYAFMDAAGLSAGDVVHGTFDVTPEVEVNLENGTTLFAIDQQPYLQGYGAVMWLMLVNKYGITPALPVTATGPGFVTAESLGASVDPDRPLELVMVQHALCAWDAFWCVVENGIREAAANMDVDVTILGPDEFNLERTASLIDQAIATQPDGIALTVSDPVLFREPINRAIAGGIPVIAYNAGAGPIADGIPYLTYLGQDEYQGGYLGGLRMMDAGGEVGVCINHQVGHVGLDARCRGFTDAFEERGFTAAVLAISSDPAASQTTIDDYYTANPNVNAFMTLGPTGANPFYAFMDAAGLSAGDVVHGTFDVTPEVVANLENGTTLFAIDQQPFLQGYGAVMALALYNRQNISPALPVTPTGPGFVDINNVQLVKELAGTYR